MIIIGGATATGKTALAAEICKKIDGEIVSADSMQIYRGMDIGTAKETSAELGIPVHCIDIVNPNEPFSVVDFKNCAEKAIADIESRGKTPVICGGTGFYINSLLYSYDYGGCDVDENVSKELKDVLLKAGGAQILHEKLAKLDPVSAEKIHYNNTKRLLRALEVTISSGKPFSEQNDTKALRLSDFKLLIIGCGDTEKYNERLEKRVEIMLDRGLKNEIADLLSKGYDFTLQSMQAIGYKEWQGFFDGTDNVETTMQAIVKNTRAYAKRQRTWFRNQYKSIGDSVYYVNDVVTPEVVLNQAIKIILK